MENQTVQNPDTGGLVSAWSYSTLKQFEKCPHSIFLSKVEKIPRAELSEDSPLNRGIKIHKHAEDYVQGIIDELPPSLRKLSTQFEELRELYSQGSVEVEGDWGFDKDWGVVDWFANNVWARIKCDVVVHLDQHSARIIDHKTGKSFGNEVAHTQQGQVYAIAAFMRFPDLEFIDVEFWYIDEGKQTRKHYSREKAMKLLPRWTERANAMTDCTYFKAKPNKMNCKWCDYGPNGNGTGDCIYGVEM